LTSINALATPELPQPLEIKGISIGMSEQQVAEKITKARVGPISAA
jgi:hypothetical protein